MMRLKTEKANFLKTETLLKSENMTSILNGMLVMLQNSQPGKRLWYSSYDGYVTYSKIESTFPDWSKFFFVKTPKRERSKYFLSGRKPYKDGYFNGNKKQLMSIIENFKKSGKQPRSERQRLVLDICIQGYEDFCKDIMYS